MGDSFKGIHFSTIVTRQQEEKACSVQTELDTFKSWLERENERYEASDGTSKPNGGESLTEIWVGGAFSTTCILFRQSDGSFFGTGKDTP